MEERTRDPEREPLSAWAGQDWDAVICGSGPVGLLFANLLGGEGVRTLLVEKRSEASTIPRAIGLCEEGSRALHRAGLLDAYAERTHRQTRVDFVNPQDESILQFDVDGSLNGYPRLRMFFQPELEAHLRNGLQRFPCVQSLTHCEVVDFRQGEEGDAGVAVHLRQGETTAWVRTRFLFGCDGANSAVRRRLGIAMKGATYAEPWLIVDADHNPEPNSRVVFFCDPQRPGVTMSAPGNRRRWEFLMRRGESEEQVLRDRFLEPLLARWGTLDSLRIARRTVYAFEARVAERFSAGRVFLLGDAAHLTPPFLGQGLMAGFRDTVNLAWKVAGTLRGTLSPAVLESYDAERRPHARQVVFLARVMGSFILPRRRAAAWVRDAIARVVKSVAGRETVRIRKTPNHIRGASLLSLLRIPHNRVGFEVPQAPLRDATGRSVRMDDLVGRHFALVSYGSEVGAFRDPDLEELWRALGGREIHLMPRRASAAGPGNTWTDDHGDYGRWLADGERVAVVRPDLMVVAHTRRRDLERELKRYLLAIGGSKLGAVREPEQAAIANPGA